MQALSSPHLPQWSLPWSPFSLAGQLLPSLPPESPSLSLYFASSPPPHREPSSKPGRPFHPFSVPVHCPPDTMPGISGQQWEDVAFSSNSTTKGLWPWALSDPSIGGLSAPPHHLPQLGFTKQFLTLPALEGQAPQAQIRGGSISFPVGQPHKTHPGQTVLNPRRVGWGHWCKQFTK